MARALRSRLASSASEESSAWTNSPRVRSSASATDRSDAMRTATVVAPIRSRRRGSSSAWSVGAATRSPPRPLGRSTGTTRPPSAVGSPARVRPWWSRTRTDRPADRSSAATTAASPSPRMTMSLRTSRRSLARCRLSLTACSASLADRSSAAAVRSRSKRSAVRRARAAWAASPARSSTSRSPKARGRRSAARRTPRVSSPTTSGTPRMPPSCSLRAAASVPSPWGKAVSAR